MKKPIFALIIFSLCITVNAQTVKMFGFKTDGDVETGCTSSNIMTWWRMEAAAQSTGDYPSSGATWTLTNTTLDPGAVKLGVNGLLQDGNGHRATIATGNGARLSGTRGRAAFWLYINTMPTSGFVYLIRLRTASSQQFHLSLTSTSKLQFMWLFSATELLTTSTPTLSTATWYFVEVEWDAEVGAGSDIAKVYVNQTPYINVSNATLTPIPDTASVLWVGSDDPYNGMSVYVDHLIVASTTTKDLYSCNNTASYPN